MDSSRVSSAVEQRFCKAKVGSSILSPGTKNRAIGTPQKMVNRARGGPSGTLFGGCRVCQTEAVTSNTSEI